MVAQTGTVSGRVTNEAGEPLAGANVAVVGADVGAATDINGEYTIENLPAGTVSLFANFIGYKRADSDVDVTAGSVTEVNFTLSRSALNLKEVVVTGAGRATMKMKLGNAVETIYMSTLVDAPVSNLAEILQAREPGISINLNGGLVGEGASIRIRGTATLSQSNEPIVYIDGVRVDTRGGFAGVSAGGGGEPSRLDDINPDAIERIEILKGAAAATLYGTQASNGIIQIFTKQGAFGKPRFTVKYEQGIITLPENRFKPGVGFARTQATADTMAAVLGLGALKPFEMVSRDFAADIYGVGQSRTISTSVSGGSAGATYFASVRYAQADGPYDPDPALFLNKEFGGAQDLNTKFQANATLNLIPTDKLRFRIGSSYSFTDHNTIENNNNIYGVSSLAVFSKPELVSSNNSTGTIAFSTVREATFSETTDKADHATVSLTTQYALSDALSISSTVGLDYVGQRSTNYLPFAYNVDNFVGNNVDGALVLGNRTHKELTLDVKANWGTTFGSSITSDLVVGFQAFKTTNNTSGGNGIIFPGPGLETITALGVRDAGSSFSEVVNAGYFLQEQVGFNDFAFLTVGIRRDANSAFGSKFTTVTYPKVGLSVVPTELMGAIGAISTMRVRVAWGQSGIQPGAFDKFTTFIPKTSSDGTAIVPANLGNDDLRPEITSETEIGAEFGLFNDRIGFELGYWSRITTDGLVARAFAPSGGFYRTQLENIGEWTGQGFDIGINAYVFQGAASSLEIFANAAFLKEEITSLGGAPKQKVGGSYPRYRNFLVEGFAPGTMFGAKLLPVSAGFYPLDTNGDGSPDSEAELLAFFADTSLMSLSGDVNAFVMLDESAEGGDVLGQFLGKPTPDWQGAFGLRGKITRSIHISTTFEYKFGNYFVTNLTDAFRRSHPAIGRNTLKSATTERDFMTGGVDGSSNPLFSAETRLAAADEWINNYLALAPFSGLNTVESADMLRLREVSISYTLPGNFAGLMGVESATITLAGRNLALWTPYSGVDPETSVFSRTNGGIDDFAQGIEAFGVPIPRQWTVKFRVNL